jgi:Tfp pilus assembly protein PilF
LKKTALAKKNLVKALELNPKYADAHFQMGLLIRSKSAKKQKNISARLYR